MKRRREAQASRARPCRRHIDASGYAGRTPLVLAREEGLYDMMAGDLASSRPGVDREPERGAPRPTVTMEHIEAGFGSDRGGTLHAAAFVAGRSEPEEAGDAPQLTEWLVALMDSLDVTSLRSRALTYVDAAMSLVLRGDEGRGTKALRDVVQGARGTMGDHLAAYYLAQLGDPSGYGLLLKELQSDVAFTRLMAARDLAGFLPYDGQQVGDETVDVRARLMERFDDEASSVAREIPGLLAEVGGSRVRETLTRWAADAKHDEARDAASWALDRLGAGD